MALEILDPCRYGRVDSLFPAAFAPHKIDSGFEASGIWFVNSDIFTKEDNLLHILIDDSITIDMMPPSTHKIVFPALHAIPSDILKNEGNRRLVFQPSLSTTVPQSAFHPNLIIEDVS